MLAIERDKAPFNDSDKCGDLLEGDKRWHFGVPSTTTLGAALIHLAARGLAEFVLANRSMWSNHSETDRSARRSSGPPLVDCMVTLPLQRI